MFDTIPVFVADFLDGAIAWVYSFQSTFEPTVILGKNYWNAQCSTLNAELDGWWRDHLCIHAYISFLSCLLVSVTT